MAEGKANPEIGKMRPVDLDKPKDPARRQVLKGLGLLTTAVFAPLLAKWLFGGKKPDESSEVKVNLGSKQSVPQDESINIATESKEVKKLFEVVFGNLSPAEKSTVRDAVDDYKRKIRDKEEYPAMLAITKKFKEEIVRETEKVGILPEAGIGIVLIESGGGEDKVSDENARGVAQLKPDTARDYELKVAHNWQKGGQDERSDPIKSIGAMANYLKDSKNLYAKNEGLMVWSYHAGFGNVYWALQEFFKDKVGVDIGDYSKAIEQDNVTERERIEQLAASLIWKNKVNVHQVLSNPRVIRNVISQLGDFTETYVYQAVAAAELFEEEIKNN